MVWQTDNSGGEMFQPDAASFLQVQAYSQDMNELQYTKALQYICSNPCRCRCNAAAMPLQCMTAEEQDRCLFYAYPEQWDSTSTMYAAMCT